jgi:hypothetical protein
MLFHDLFRWWPKPSAVAQLCEGLEDGFRCAAEIPLPLSATLPEGVPAHPLQSRGYIDLAAGYC